MKRNKVVQQSFFTRRGFISTSLAAVGASSIGVKKAEAFSVRTSAALTIADVIEVIKNEIQFDASRGTVDTIKIGDANQPVKGIVTTMFATIDVIRKAIDVGANFIIAHEPTFYGHLDETTWLESHDVYKFKRDLLNKHNIVVWRFHDYWHSNKPDGVFMGVLTALGWEKHYDEKNPRLINLPLTKLKDIISLCKNKLDIPTVRFIGDPSQECSKIAILPGASGGRGHMNVLQTYKPDLLIVGELQEWETSEYIRDVQAMGGKQSLLVLGHSVSEEPGMSWLVQWLQPKVKDVKITHVPSKNPFKWA